MTAEHASGRSIVPALGLPPQAEDRIRAAMAPWVAAGALTGGACVVAAAAARRCGELDPDVFLALALAFDTLREGHTGLALRTWTPRVAASAVRSVDGPVAALPSVPEREMWLGKVAASAAVAVEKAGCASSAPFVLHGDLLSVARMAHAERSIAAGLAALLRNEPADAPATEAICGWLGRFTLALFGSDAGEGEVDRQALAVARGVSSALTVVTGGPGMGKTWSIRGLLIGLMLCSRFGGSRCAPSVALAAPTGKAAARMREAIQEDLEGLHERYERALEVAGHAPWGEVPRFEEVTAFLADMPEFTLHRLLGPQPRTPSRFRHHRANPLGWDVVVLDEASMADVSMMAALLDAIDPRRTRLVLVGDRNQLASVDSGTVLSDVCGDVSAAGAASLEPSLAKLAVRWGLAERAAPGPARDAPIASAVVPFVRFHRFDANSGIGLLAGSVVRYPPEDWPVDEVIAGLRSGRNDFVWHDGGSHEERSAAAVHLAAARYRPLVEAAEATELVLEAPQRLSHESAAHFERLLGLLEAFRVLAPHRIGRDGVDALSERIASALRGVASPGSREGGRYWRGLPLLVNRNDYGLGLYNGDIGLVLPVATDSGVSLRAIFRVARGRDVAWRVLSPERIPEASSALAMTIHKCQGSQFGSVALVLPGEVSPLLTRELVYTGVTRARRGVELFGSEEVLRASLSARVRRNASLAQRLWGDP